MTTRYENQSAHADRSRGDRQGSWLAGIGRHSHHLGAHLLGALLPRACLLCGEPCGRHACCIHCSKLLTGTQCLRCPLCALPLPQPLPRPLSQPLSQPLPPGSMASACTRCCQQPPPLSATLTLADYAPPLDRALSALKFNGQLALASPLGALLMAHLQQDHPARLAQIDALVPIPLAGPRLAERGFNQSLQIARGMRAYASGPCPPIESDWLRRQRHTAPQSSLSRSARLTNLIGAFQVPRPDLVTGKRIALVDDVMTTGSTLHEAARCLLRAGAQDVVALVVARTPA